MTLQTAAPGLDQLQRINEILARIGGTQRELATLALARDARIAAATAEHESKAAELRQRIEADTDEIQAVCTALRAHLTVKGKTVTLAAGKVGWRKGSAKLVYAGTDDELVKQLRQLKLRKFLRTKVEPDRTALKKDAAAVAKVPGLSIAAGAEVFFVEPA